MHGSIATGHLPITFSPHIITGLLPTNTLPKNVLFFPVPWIARSWNSGGYNFSKLVLCGVFG
jgi:hypothetical protein